MNSGDVDELDVKKAEREQEDAVIVLPRCCAPCCFTTVAQRHIFFLGFLSINPQSHIIA